MRSLAITFIAAVLTIAAAQQWDMRNVNDVFANETDGIVMPCPKWVEATVDACHTHFTSVNVTRMKIENAVASFGDIWFVSPWRSGQASPEQGGWRATMTEGGQVIAFMVFRVNDFETLVYVVELTD